MHVVQPELPSTDKRWKIINTTMRRAGFAPHALIEALHGVQDAFGFIDEDAMRFVAASLDLPLSKVYGTATFYHLFQLKPQGRHTCVVCTGTACYIRGAGALVEGVEQRYGVLPGHTTDDKSLSVMAARCVGACGLAPAAVIDGTLMGQMTPEKLLDRLAAEVAK